MSILSKLQALLTAANTKTGESDTTLTDAMQTLIDGYGQGGGGGGNEVIKTTIISNSSGDVSFDSVLEACESMGYTLTYKDCILKFRAKGPNAASDPISSNAFNNQTLLVKDWVIWNVQYNRSRYTSATTPPDGFVGNALIETNNPIQNSGSLIDANHKIVNTYESGFESIGGSGTTVTLFEIPVDWSDFISTL